MHWLPLLIVGWLGFGFGMAFASWLLLTAQDTIHINVESPQHFLARAL